MTRLRINIDGIKSLKQLKNSSLKYKVILFGETHGFIPQEKDYIESIIKSLKPELIIYELLENKRLINSREINSFLKHPANRKFSLISAYGELKKIINLARKYKLPIIGCDFKNMGRKEPINFNKKLTKKDQAYEERILKKREKQQVKIIKGALKKNKLIMVIVGAYHLRNNSPLLKLTKGGIIIYPTYKEKREFSPENVKTFKNVSFYMTSLKNQK